MSIKKITKYDYKKLIAPMLAPYSTNTVIEGRLSTKS
jgi:hypothetical protein